MKSVLHKLAAMAIGSCTCITKTQDTSYHSEDCLYRNLVEVRREVKQLVIQTEKLQLLEELVTLGSVGIHLDDNGYVLTFEYAENIPTAVFVGDTLEACIEETYKAFNS